MAVSQRSQASKIFLDSSIIVSAILSTTGGSFRLFLEGHHQRLRLFTNQYVVEEVAEVLLRKYPPKVVKLPRLLDFGKCQILKNPPLQFVKQYLGLIDDEDLAVLTGALKARADYLITHDQKDFLTSKLENADLPVIIATPKQFFQEHWTK